MNAHTWYRITGIARMIPTTIAILSAIENASPSPRVLELVVGQRRDEDADERVAEVEPDERGQDDGDAGS